MVIYTQKYVKLSKVDIQMAMSSRIAKFGTFWYIIYLLGLPRAETHTGATRQSQTHTGIPMPRANHANGRYAPVADADGRYAPVADATLH